MRGNTETETRRVISGTSWTETDDIAGIGAETGVEIVTVIITETEAETEGTGDEVGAEIVIVTVIKDTKTVEELQTGNQNMTRTLVKRKSDRLCRSPTMSAMSSPLCLNPRSLRTGRRH